MTTQIRCPSCNSLYRLPPEARGKQVRCRKCNGVFQVATDGEDDSAPVEPIEPAEERSSLPRARLVNPGPALQREPDSPSDPDVLPDLLPDRVRRPIRRASGPSAFLIVGLVLGGLFFLGAGYGAARLWFLPRSDDSGDSVANKDGDKEGQGGVPGDEPLPAIKPPTLEKDRVECPLPGPIKDLVVGGAGRFLVLHLPDKRQLAIFDASEAKITRYLPVAADHVRFAAGRDKLITVLPDSKLIQRWNLHTGEREVSTTLPFQGIVKALALGSDSQGPLLVQWAADADELANAPVDFLDLQTLKPLNIQRAGRGREHSVRDIIHFRASTEGSVFGYWATSHTPQGIGSLVIAGKTAQTHQEHDSAGHIVPGPDGKHLYTGRGLFTNQAKRVGDPRGQRLQLLPAHHGQAYVGFSAPRERVKIPGMPDEAVKGLTVYLSGNDRPVVTLPEVEVPAVDDAWTTSDFTLDKRIHLIPAARLLVVVPASNDKLVLHRFDLEAALDKAGIDYLFVTSAAPSKAAKGKRLRYQVAVKSKQGGVKYKLESGPQGMSVSTAGLLTWEVPADAPPEVPIILTIGDKTGQEIFHTFKLTIE